MIHQDASPPIFLDLPVPSLLTIFTMARLTEKAAWKN